MVCTENHIIAWRNFRGDICKEQSQTIDNVERKECKGQEGNCGKRGQTVREKTKKYIQ